MSKIVADLSAVTVVSVDLAKHVFQVHAVDAGGKVEPGDLFLMCSDGLSDMLDDEAIAQILTGDGSLEQKTVQLIDAANANGGRDNISVLLAQSSSGSRKRGLISRWLGQ